MLSCPEEDLSSGPLITVSKKSRSKEEIVDGNRVGDLGGCRDSLLHPSRMSC